MTDFDAVASRWDTSGKMDRSQKMAHVMRQKIADRFAGEAVSRSGVEYGSGTGALGFELIDQFTSLVFIDTSAGMLEQVEAKIRDRQPQISVRTIKGNAEENPIDGLLVDVIFSSLAFHHIPHTERLLMNLRSMLKPGGLLLVVDLDEDGGDFHGHHGHFDGHHGFDRDQLATQARQAGFAEVTIEDGPAFSKDSDSKSFSTFLLSARN